MKLTLDIKELWQDCKETLQYTYLVWTDPKIAPPSIRTYDVGFVILLDKNKRNMGCFVPELYELAKVNGLRAQQAEKRWEQENPLVDFQKKKQERFYDELYYDDGTRKSHFALSVIPEIYSDENKHCTRKIQKYLEREFNSRIEKRQPLPPIVFKYQIQSDYLKYLHLIQLQVGEARSFKINILNPRRKTPLIERMSHYLAQRAALILTLMTLLSITIINPYLFASATVFMILGKWCSDEFSTYGLTETLLRDVRSIFAKEFRWGDKISLKKTIKTLILLIALGFLAYNAFTGTWASVTSYAIWNTTNTFLLLSKNVLAGFASMLAAISTFASGTCAQRYFWGLGIWDKQIDFSKERPLKPCRQSQFDDKIIRFQRKFLAALRKKNLPKEEFNEGSAKTMLLFAHLNKILHNTKQTNAPTPPTSSALLLKC